MEALSLPPPPYIAVIFSSVLKEDAEGYQETAEILEKLSKGQEGFFRDGEYAQYRG